MYCLDIMRKDNKDTRAKIIANNNENKISKHEQSKKKKESRNEFVNLLNAVQLYEFSSHSLNYTLNIMLSFVVPFYLVVHGVYISFWLPDSFRYSNSNSNNGMSTRVERERETVVKQERIKPKSKCMFYVFVVFYFF